MEPQRWLSAELNALLDAQGLPSEPAPVLRPGRRLCMRVLLSLCCWGQRCVTLPLRWLQSCTRRLPAPAAGLDSGGFLNSPHWRTLLNWEEGSSPLHPDSTASDTATLPAQLQHGTKRGRGTLPGQGCIGAGAALFTCACAPLLSAAACPK